MSESQPPESGLSAPEQQGGSPQQQDPQSWAPAESQPQAPQPQEAPQPWAPADQSQVPQQWSPPDAQPLVPQQYDPRGFQAPPQARSAGTTGFTSAERFWYLLGNIALGAMYLRKVPAKKAMSEFGLVEMTSGEKTWYTILCILCGAGYFAKLPVAKAISETPPYVTRGQGLTDAGRFWYLVGCLAYGANYFAKVSAKKALSDFGLAALNDTEGAWYTILCIACGLGYFAKSRWPRPSARCRSSAPPPRSRRPSPVTEPPTGNSRSARPVGVATALRSQRRNAPGRTGTLVGRSPRGPHAALAQTEERRTRNA